MLEWITQADEYLIEIVNHFGIWAYLLFFLVVFGECGLVPMIFLPGDGFIFSIGVIAASNGIEIKWIYPVLIVAAILGYQVNFYTGRWFGGVLLRKKTRKWIKENHLNRAEQFFSKYGRKAVLFGRFIPIVRTVVPFVGGVSNMEVLPFSMYNIIGGLIWISIFCLGGYFLGTIPFVAEHFLLIYLLMILLATVPSFLTAIYYSKKKN